MVHPWRILRDMPHVTVLIVDMPIGENGYCDHATNTIYLRKGMRQRQRRGVLLHELFHLQRGPVFANAHYQKREERAVDVATAHALIDLDRLVDALKWTRNVFELADELHVSPAVVRCRIEHLHPAEKGYLKRELSHPAGMLDQ